MCLITEHARLKVEYQNLEETNKELLSRVEELENPTLPDGFQKIDIKWLDLVAELEDLGLKLMLKQEFVPDKLVTHTDEAGWVMLTPYLIYPADYYVEQVADCDDYSRWAASDCSKLFKLNGCLQCWGDSPWGYHAYSLVRLASGIYRIFEPNAGGSYAGELMKFGERGYMPKSWK